MARRGQPMLAAMDEPAEQHNEHLKEFFLNLARPAEDTEEARAAARERWNAWIANQTEQIRVTFDGVDFRIVENASISFRGCIFPAATSFERTLFYEMFSLSDATFGIFTSFRHSVFTGGVSFNRCNFVKDTTFFGCCFGDGANFTGSQFGCVVFMNSRFGDSAVFASCLFNGIADFEFVSFGNNVDFSNSAILSGNFDDCIFGAMSNFYGSAIGSYSSFRRAIFKGDVTFRSRSFENWLRHNCYDRFLPGCDIQECCDNMREWSEDKNLSPIDFSVILFSYAIFAGTVSFEDRKFSENAQFIDAIFYMPPLFEGASGLQRIDFTGAEVGFAPPDQPRWRPHWTEDSTVPIRLRAFRKAAEDTKNHDLERDLYIEERKAERGVHRKRLREAFFAERSDPRQIARLGPLFVHWCWRRVMGVYWLLSDYGRSLIRPLLALAVTLPLFVAAFDASLAGRREAAVSDAREIATGSPQAREAAAQATEAEYRAATRQLAYSNAIPFVGPLSIDGEVKKFLLCGAPPADEAKLKRCVPIAPGWYQATMIAQNVLSALLLFFFGLALRNYFRVK